MIYDGGEILTETSPAGYLINDYIFFGGKRVAAAPNDLDLNGGFEQGLTNWSATGAGTATAVNNPANAHSGNYYAEVTAPAGYTITTLSTTQPISSQVGETVTAAGWVYHETDSTGYTRWWLTVQGSNGGCVTGQPVNNNTMNAWIYQVVTLYIPTGCTGPFTATVFAQVASDSNSASARFDDVTLNGNLTLFAEDLLGTSRIVTDNNGVVCYDSDFYPYGGERAYTNTCDPVYKFEGKERDVETGNDDFGARYYSNRFGRWLSADWSAVPVAVPYANLTNPQTLNLYAMVADDPESFADLNGHYICAGTKAQCTTIADALAQAREAANSKSLSAAERAAIQKVVDTFGKAGDDHDGVTVKFGKLQSPTATADANSYKQDGIFKTDVTFNSKAFNSLTTVEVAGVLVHERSHGIDGIAAGGRNPQNKKEEFTTERHAYNVESYVPKGLGLFFPRLWDPKWKPEYADGTRYMGVLAGAFASTHDWCQRGGAPG